MLLSRLNQALKLALLGTFAVSASAANGLIAKQLAGPAEEFAELAPVDAARSAVYSKAALVPFSAGQNGVAVLDLPVDGDNPSALLLGNNAQLRIGAKGSESIAQRGETSTLSLDGASVTGARYELGTRSAGNYQFDISAAGDGFILLEGSDQTQLVSYIAEGKQTLGNTVTVLARMAGGSAERASMTLTDPNGTKTTLPMFDDGLHNDGYAFDGVFGGQFRGEMAGNYVSSSLVFGKNTKGESVVRSAEQIIPIAEDSIDLAGRVDSTLAIQKNGRLSIRVPVIANSSAQHYRGYAQVWGKDARGNDLAIAWVGGMVQANNGAIEFGLDPRWIEKAGASGPFQLRELRLENPDNFVSLETKSSIALLGEVKISSSKARAIEIDDLMRMGPRPALSFSERGVGQRLLLVHGYCSGAVWPAANFTNASTFLDANKNRSHDAFARLISSFGATWNSFGIVAHSQGGAAALHLYHYYWSGLDNASGGRVIQSVGTPYKGTNLAGVLAALGGIFGVGCGTNTDLTYSGAARWLAGISNASRAKVNYYTTSFKQTGFFTNDYCNFASDLVLSDPEDGTTEVANGQLSGGVNRGNVTGQCHTDGMRDPAQYRDASRNATMNNNAAR